MMKKFFALIILGLGLSLNSQALTIDLIPSATQINSGDVLKLDATISGLKTAGALALGVYDLNIHFDSNLFAFNSITWGDSVKGNQLDLNHFGSLQMSDDSNSNLLNLFELSFDSAWSLETLQADSFTLFSVMFSNLTTGNGVFQLSVNALGDAYGNNLNADSINNTTVKVQAVSVPEPATNFLMLIGLIALGFARIRPQA
jgi:hypothetical protein